MYTFKRSAFFAKSAANFHITSLPEKKIAVPVPVPHFVLTFVSIITDYIPSMDMHGAVDDSFVSKGRKEKKVRNIIHAWEKPAEFEE